MIKMDGKGLESKWKAKGSPEELLLAALADDPNFDQRFQFGMDGCTWVLQNQVPVRNWKMKLKLWLARTLVDSRIGVEIIIGSRRFVYSLDSENI